MSLDNIKLIAGRSNPELSEGISKKLGIPLTKVDFKDFGNSEIFVNIKESIRGFDVFIIQTGCKYQGRSIEDHRGELEQLIDACVLSDSKTINVIIPCFPYARSDKHDDGRISIGSARVARGLKFLGVKRIITIDLHSGQTQSTIQLPFDNLYGINLHIENLQNTIFKGLSQKEINEKYVLVSPDAGGVKKTEAYATKLGMNYVIMHKHRDYSKVNTVLNSRLIGKIEDVDGKTAILIDDIIDSMGTMISASNELSNYGVTSVIILATHGVFSGEAIKRINDSKFIQEVIVMDTLPQLENCQKAPKIKVVQTSELFAEVITILQTGGSISALFK